MRTFIAIGLVLLAAASAQAQTMGELNAAQGVHHSLAGRGASNHATTLNKARESVKRSNARHNSALARASAKGGNAPHNSGKPRASVKRRNPRPNTRKIAQARGNSEYTVRGGANRKR